MTKRTPIHPALLVALGIATIAGAVSWGTRDRSPAQPPANATAAQKRAFWRDHIRRDATDMSAYARLGQVEERSGFYLSARRNLLAARALGVPDTQTAGPLGRALVGLARYDEAEPELARAYRLTPDDVEAAVNLAGVYVLLDDSDKAAQTLRDWITAHPNINDEATIQRLTMCAVRVGDKNTSKLFSSKLSSVAPDNPLGWIIQGQFALSAKQPDAPKFFARAVAAAPSEGSMHYLHGFALEVSGDKSQALQKYLQAVRLNARAVDAREKIAKIAASRGDWKEAANGMVWIARAASSYETASSAAQACEKAGRTNDALYWNAVAAGYQSRFGTALTLSMKARDSAATDAQRTRALGAMAEAYRGMRRKKEYLATVREWTKGGTLPELVDRAEAYHHAQDYTGEMALLTRVIQQSPPETIPAINRRLAQAAASRQIRDEEERYLETAVKQDPNVASWHMDLANLYFERRSDPARLQKAIHHYQEAIRLAADDQDSTTWLRLGLSYAEQGDMTRALYHAEHAVDLEPGYGAAYQELARMYSRVGDKNSSREMLSLYQKYVQYDQELSTLRSRARAPQATLADYTTYADLLLRSGSTEDAMSWYEQALARAPKDKKIRQRLARLYTRLRLPDRALAQGVAL